MAPEIRHRVTEHRGKMIPAHKAIRPINDLSMEEKALSLEPIGNGTLFFNAAVWSRLEATSYKLLDSALLRQQYSKRYAQKTRPLLAPHTENSNTLTLRDMAHQNCDSSHPCGRLKSAR